ncbi:MAG TPA: hypothetical protein EYN51_08830, partial [Flavobacteriales bacterium]|nr:hypothetical protein [Flavobacteriales bacterium]
MFRNRIKTYPKAEFFIYDGKVYYNDSFIPFSGSEDLPPLDETFYILSEDGDILATELEERLLQESAPSSGPSASVFSTFEFSGWPGTVDNPITSSDFTTYNNSATSSYEFSGWPGTVANPITSSDFATYNNSATASFELGPWEFSF